MRRKAQLKALPLPGPDALVVSCKAWSAAKHQSKQDCTGWLLYENHTLQNCCILVFKDACPCAQDSCKAPCS